MYVQVVFERDISIEILGAMLEEACVIKGRIFFS
jgi:hypothetical protein